MAVRLLLVCSRLHHISVDVNAPKVLLSMLERKSTKDDRYMLVVSIDNLDRCPHRQIVKVLEAVHLLLENDEVTLLCRGYGLALMRKI